MRGTSSTLELVLTVLFAGIIGSRITSGVVAWPVVVSFSVVAAMYLLVRWAE